MKQLESYINEKLRVSTDYQEITVENLIDALYNYGPSLLLKDVFGRTRVILEPSEYLDKDEEGYGGSKIFEIYFKINTVQNLHGVFYFSSFSLLLRRRLYNFSRIPPSSSNLDTTFFINL